MGKTQERIVPWKYSVKNHRHKAGSLDGLRARHGEIRFSMAPGTDEAGANGMYIFEAQSLRAAADKSYIRLYFSGNNEVTLAYLDARNASAVSDTWDCTGALAHDGTEYDVRIRYEPYTMRLWIDGVLKITLENDVDFGSAIPDYFTLGTDIDAANTYTSTTFKEPTENIYWYSDGVNIDKP